MYKKPLLVLTGLLLLGSLQAQQRWDLKSCVDYAFSHNVGIRQAGNQVKNAELTYNQSISSQFPTAIFGTSGSINSGNNQDPVTFRRVTQTYFTTGFQLQSSADIFNFFSKRNTIAANEWTWMAEKAGVDKVKNDLALSVANAYLTALLSQEQERILQVQLNQTDAQLDMTRRMVKAGSLPELNASQLEAQYAMDSSNYISAKGNTEANLLSLKNLMNLDAATPMELAAPPIDIIPVEPIADLQPENVYQQALANQPQQKSNQFRLKAAEKNSEAAKGSRLPTLSAFASLSTNYLAFHREPIYQTVVNGYTNSGLIVEAGGITLPVQAPIVARGDVIGYARPEAFFSQLDNNFRQVFGVNLNVPIFNGGILRTNYERSRVAVESARLQQEQDDQKLKQDIYQAYNAALVALQKQQATARAVEANEKTYSYARKRYDIGMLSTFDLITSQNNLLRSKLDHSINRYDYVFKMKVLEFYKGNGIKL